MTAKELLRAGLLLLCVDDGCLKALMDEDQQDKLHVKGRRSLP